MRDVESADNLLIEIQSFKAVLNIKKEDSLIHLTYLTSH